MKPVVIGSKGSASVTVDEHTLASVVGSGSLPVYATPMMVALMEKAACAAIEPYLEEDETTVGTALQISHDAATPVGMTVTAAAEITAVSGREITYQVTAQDESGLIGSGVHKRFLVFAERFVQKTYRKQDQ